MSANSSNNKQQLMHLVKKLVHNKIAQAVALPVWVLIGFGIALLIVQQLVYLLVDFGVSFAGVDESIVNAVIAAVIYLLSILIVIGVPWYLRRDFVTKEAMGMTRLPSWTDIFLSPVGFIIYLIGSGLLVYLASQVIPGFNADQTQSTGFTHLTYYSQYLVAFMTLIIVAPLAEETLFRGFLYGKLRKIMPVWVAMIITSALFGFVHGQWNVGVDVFALSLVLCGLREVTGNIWAGMLLHMIKNGIAFYILFVNPMM
jgi:membrane protease YdiL (CAAX protease family)